MLVLPHLHVRERNALPREHFAHAGIDAAVEHELIGGARLLQVREVRTLDALLAHPDVARIEGDVVAGCTGAEDHHPAALDHQRGDRERLLARMLEHDVDVALAGDVPDRLAELARFLDPHVVFGRADFGQLAPAGEVFAVDPALGAELHHIFAFGGVRHDADRVGARRGGELHAEYAEAAGGAPYQHVVAGLERVRRVAEQHAIGGRQGERVAGRLFPREVPRLLHQLAGLHAAELRGRAVRRLVTPDALRGGEQRVAAVAFLVVAVVLIAVDNDFVAHLPAPYFAADRPHDA